MSIEMQRHCEFVQIIFDYTIKEIFNLDYNLRIMRRTKKPTGRTITIGYINFSKRIICLDVFTLKKRKAKSISSLLRTVAHEVAHIQKPPYRQRYQGRYIIRQHYPSFYKQVTKNIEKIKKDPTLSIHFKS